MGNRAVLGSFIGVLCLITYRDFKNPDPSWPLGPVPPPYRYTYSAVIFGILSLVSDIWSPQIATIVAVGVLMGVAYSVISAAPATVGLMSNAPGYSSGTAKGTPATGSTPTGGGIEPT